MLSLLIFLVLIARNILIGRKLMLFFLPLLYGQIIGKDLSLRYTVIILQLFLQSIQDQFVDLPLMYSKFSSSLFRLMTLLSEHHGCRHKTTGLQMYFHTFNLIKLLIYFHSFFPIPTARLAIQERPYDSGCKFHLAFPCPLYTDTISNWHQ